MDEQSDRLAKGLPGTVRLLSWNLLHRAGARAGDAADLVVRHAVDVALFQEADENLDGILPMLGGYIARRAMRGTPHGPAAWSRMPMSDLNWVELPEAGAWDVPSPLFGKPIVRAALVATVLGVTFATVHLDHGQIANRRQLRHLVRSRPGIAVIAGDFNALGPLDLPSFRDVGPRTTTHVAKGLVPLRLDRCLVRGMRATAARALDRGRSDHRPILVDLVGEVAHVC